MLRGVDFISIQFAELELPTTACINRQERNKLCTLVLRRNGNGDDGDALRCEGRRVNEQAAVHAEMKLLLLPGYQA